MTTGPSKFKTFLEESITASSLKKELHSILVQAAEISKLSDGQQFRSNPTMILQGRIVRDLDDNCEKLEQYLAMSQIPGPRFAETVEYFKSFFEKSFEWTCGSYAMILWLRELRDSKHPQADAMDELYYANRSLSSSPSILRKVNGILVKFPDSKLLLTIKELAEIGSTLKKEIDAVKPKIVKGRVIDPNKVSDKFVPTFTVDSFKKMHDEMEKQLDSTRKNHEDAIYKHYLDVCQKIFDEMKEINADTMFKYFNRSRLMRQPGLARDIYYRIIDSSESKIADDWKDRVRQIVVRDVKNMYDTFMAKNARKLAAIIDKKNEMPEIKSQNSVSGISLVNRMWIKFSDGASFEVTNNIEYVINSFGTSFLRFPTRFTNVKLSSGLMMSSPSEEKMSKEFV